MTMKNFEYKKANDLSKLNNYKPTEIEKWYDNTFCPEMHINKVYACDNYNYSKIDYTPVIDKIFLAIGKDKNNFDIDITGIFLKLKNKDADYPSYVIMPANIDNKIGLAVLKGRHIDDCLNQSQNNHVNFINTKYDLVYKL